MAVRTEARAATTEPASIARDERGFVGRFADLRDPGRQAFLILWLAFTVAPIAFGADKFARVMTEWDRYLAPSVARIFPWSAHTSMLIVGAIEIVAGVLVFIKPRYAAYVVALWLAGIITNLLILGDYYDVALRDFGLLLAALALARRSVRSDGGRAVDAR